MPEVRLIDSNSLHEKICKDSKNNYGASLNIAQVLLYIETAPTVEAEPVRHGRWMPTVYDRIYQCSVCHFEQTSNPNQRFCSYCGADMREVSENATD